MRAHNHVCPIAGCGLRFSSRADLDDHLEENHAYCKACDTWHANLEALGLYVCAYGYHAFPLLISIILTILAIIGIGVVIVSASIIIIRIVTITINISIVLFFFFFFFVFIFFFVLVAFFFFAGFLQTCLVLVRNRQRHQDLKHPSCSYCNRQFHSLKALNRHRYSRINGICAKATPGFTGTVAEPSVMAYLNTSEGMLHATVNLVESESAATSPTKGSVSSASYGTGRGGGGGGGGGGYGNTTRVLGGGRAASSKYSFSSTNRSHVSKHNTTKRAATSPAKGGYTSYLANSPQRTSTPPRSRGSRIPADQGSGALDDLAFDASHVAHDHGRGNDESHRQHDMTHMQPHSHSHIHRSYGSNKAKLSSTVSGWQTSKSPTKGGGRPGARTRTRDGGVANRTFVPASEATQMSVSFRSEVDVSRWVI